MVKRIITNNTAVINIGIIYQCNLNASFSSKYSLEFLPFKYPNKNINQKFSIF